MTSTAPPQPHMPSIGASMMEYIRRYSQSPESPETNRQHNNQSGDPDYEYALPLNSLLAAAMNDDTDSMPTLLRGPRRSGKSSLLMNMAQTLASSEDYTKSCRGNCGGRRACHCVAVVVLRPATSDAENNRFPLSISRVPEDVNENVHTTLAAQLEALEQSIEPRPPPTWDTAALRRVRVIHVASFRDLLEYLLSLQALPVSQRPYRGILVDDVDVLARQTTVDLAHDVNDVNHGAPQQRTTQEIMNLTQILALLADTAHVLHHRGGGRSLRVIASMESGLPFNAEHMLSNWFPLSLDLKPSNGTTWNHATISQATGQGADGQMTFEDFWTLNRAGDEQRMGMGKLELARVRSMDSSHLMFWKKEESE